MDTRILAASNYAKLIADNSNNTVEINRYRTILGLNDTQQSVCESTHDSLHEDSGTVGIWTLDENKNFYLRDKQFFNEFPYWSKTKKIPSQKRGFRIVFLGESVARGFLYDPKFTPAGYLESLLNKFSSYKNYEIIDLSRLGMTIEILQKTLMQSRQLKPDLIIIFSGNNFRESIFPLTAEEMREYNKHIKSDAPIEGIGKIIDQKMNNLISDLFKNVQDIKSQDKTPFLFIIPEFNLKNWKSNENEKEQFLNACKTQEWLVRLNNADKAFKNKDYSKAKKYYTELTEINSANTYAFEKLGEIYEHLGELEKARFWYEQARDSRFLNWSRASVCTSQIKNKILQYANACSIEVIDLQELFRELYSNSIPGRDLFLDNCHMTSKGIISSMKMAAEKICQMIEEAKDTTLFWSDDSIPDTDIEASARFSAAIYNAHIGAQPYETLYADLMDAICFDNTIIKKFICYLNMATEKVLWVLNKYYEDLVADNFTIMSQMDECKILDIPLCQAMIDVLKDKTGTSLAKEMNEKRVENFGPHNGAVNLLESYFRENSYVKTMGESLNDRFSKEQMYISLTNSTSNFFLIAKKNYSMKATITLRVPSQYNQTVTIKLNDLIICKILVSQKWQTSTFDINHRLLQENGINYLTIQWPLSEYFERSENDDILKLSKNIYGEIIHFYVSQT